MNHAVKLPFAFVALVGATVLSCKTEISDAAPSAPATNPAMDPAAAMQKMMELAQPGPAHKELAKGVGSWDEHFKMRMSPDEPWMEFDGTSEIKPLLGGRYVQEDVNFQMEGMPMQGLGIMGYDNMTQEYTSLWADSMSTWWVESRGKKDAKGTIDFKGTMVDVAGKRPFRMVVRHPSDDLTEVEMYDTIPPKGEVVVMTITAKRKK